MQSCSTNAVRFGGTLEEAVRLNPKQIDDAVDYAVLAQDGKAPKALGGVPVRKDPSFLETQKLALESEAVATVVAVTSFRYRQPDSDGNMVVPASNEQLWRKGQFSVVDCGTSP